MNIQQCCALYENNNGFPRLLTPRELSRSVVSNVLRRRPQSSCVCVHICLATWILAPQWTHLSYSATLYFFSLSTQPQFSLSFTCKLLNDLLCFICKIGHAWPTLFLNSVSVWRHIYQTILLLARYLQDMYITDYLQFSYSALYAAAASFWI